METMDNRANTTEAMQSAIKSPRGPVLSLAFNGDMVLTENGKSRIVKSDYRNGYLRIGCTTIDAAALTRLRAFLDGEDTIRKDAEMHDV